MDPLVELNARVRTLIDRVRTLDAPAPELRAAVAQLDELNGRLAPFTWGGPYQQAMLRSSGTLSDLNGSQDPHEFFPYSPVIGERNPLSPPVRLWFEPPRMRGAATFGAPYNGPPSMVHGGVIALTFDELLGALGVALGVGGFTGTLAVRYERPTPLLAPVELEAWLDRTEGRKAFLAGEIRVDGAVTARAEGVFIRARETAPPADAGTSR